MYKNKYKLNKEHDKNIQARTFNMEKDSPFLHHQTDDLLFGALNAICSYSDEIDIGISGLAADKVGEKLKIISNKHQVLIVTHLANIAAKGDYNYYIHKEVEENKTKYGLNIIKQSKPKKWYHFLLKSLFSSFNIILLSNTLLLNYTDVVYPEVPRYANIKVIHV